MRLSFFANRFLRDRDEEILNALTHVFGLGLAVSMTSALCWRAASLSDTHMFSGLAYGIAHILVYLFSVAYHYTESPPLKSRFRFLDQSAIYAAIAGTYTPVLAIGVPSPWNVVLLALVWAACIWGIAYKARNRNQPERGSLTSYVAFSVAGALLFLTFSTGPIANSRDLFIVSGALDVFGLVFYMWHYKRFFHTAWHVLVMAGNVIHFCAVWNYFMI